MTKVYRALIRDTGEILESDDFRSVYRAALSTAKSYVDDDRLTVLFELESAWYSDIVYINSYGYPQSDIVTRDHIAYICVSGTGVTVDVAGGSVLEYERSGNR